MKEKDRELTAKLKAEHHDGLAFVPSRAKRQEVKKRAAYNANAKKQNNNWRKLSEMTAWGFEGFYLSMKNDKTKTQYQNIDKKSPAVSRMELAKVRNASIRDHNGEKKKPSEKEQTEKSSRSTDLDVIETFFAACNP